MTIVSTLNRVVNETMPKVIGPTRTFYVRRPDVRLFEDDLWRNIDINFHNDDVFMLVDWNITSGDMVCASYKAIELPSGQTAFGLRLRSYMQALPSVSKRDAAATEEREAVRIADSLHWCIENKHGVQKLIVRTSNPIKKLEKLLGIFHKTLTDKGLQVGLRPVDSLTETGAFGATMWHVAQSQSSEGGVLLTQDVAQSKLLINQHLEPPARTVSEGAPLSTRAGRQSANGSSALDAVPNQPPQPFTSTPLDWSPPEPDQSPLEVPPHSPYAGPSGQFRDSSTEPDPPAYGYSSEKQGEPNHQGIVGWNYEPREDNEISLVAGQIVTNIDMVDKDWWRGTNAKGETGLFPANHVVSKKKE